MAMPSTQKESSQLDKAIRQFKSIARPGDVILIDEKYPYYRPDRIFGSSIIKRCQRRLFGKNHFWRDNHAMVYFFDCAFSAEIPRAIYRPMERFVLEKISIYRYIKKKINSEDISRMKKAADKLIGKKYSYGQLLNILMDQTIGLPFSHRLNFFGYNSDKLVCSIGVGLIYNAFTKKNNLPRIFSRLNPDAWSKEFIRRFNENGRKWDVETTYPDCFANSETHFDREFKKVAEFQNGKRIE